MPSASRTSAGTAGILVVGLVEVEGAALLLPVRGFAALSGVVAEWVLNDALFQLQPLLVGTRPLRAAGAGGHGCPG
jgi:hypothetical protein